MAKSLSNHEINELREVFELMDKDKGGSLDYEEIKHLIDMLGMKIRDDEFDQIMAEIDEDGSGQIKFDEFVQVMTRTTELPFSKADLLRSFNILAQGALEPLPNEPASTSDDPAASAPPPPGMIHISVLERMLTTYCAGKVPDDEIMRLVHGLDVDERGYIDFAGKVGDVMK